MNKELTPEEQEKALVKLRLILKKIKDKQKKKEPHV